MSANGIILKYIAFFESRGHKRIANSPLVPENDPTTLFTSSGMQPLVPYLLGEVHPAGNRLMDVQNCFRAVDIDVIGDNSHTTFFRMLGNWSLGDYFKKEEIPWLWEFLTIELSLPKDKLFITVFGGDAGVPYDHEAEDIWKKIFEKEGIEPKIFAAPDNWWSRSGPPDKMPAGEPGGPDTEVYYIFDDISHSNECQGDDPTKCVCGKFLEIANSVFMQYIKQEDDTFKPLPKSNVDFGGGAERLLAAVENKSDVHQTSLFSPIISKIEELTDKKYSNNNESMRIVADHFISALFLALNNVTPSNKEQGYILRRLIRRGLDNFYKLGGNNLDQLLETIVVQYSTTDPELKTNFEKIKNIVVTEENGYRKTLELGKVMIEKELEKHKIKREADLNKLMEIPAKIAFMATTSFGLGPTQLESLGYTFDKQEFAKVMKEHQDISRAGATQKFAGGLADHSEQTVRGHTATHLLHQAIRDMLGTEVSQKGSNITSERLRFDFNSDRNLTPEEIIQLQEIVNNNINQNLPVYFEMMPIEKAKEIGAIGLFDDKYAEDVKVYMIGDKDPKFAYSKEFCGGPHVSFTQEIKSFKIIKQENIGNGLRRIYALVG